MRAAKPRSLARLVRKKRRSVRSQWTPRGGCQCLNCFKTRDGKNRAINQESVPVGKLSTHEKPAWIQRSGSKRVDRLTSVNEQQKKSART